MNEIIARNEVSELVSQATLFNASLNPDFKITDCINETIELVSFFIERVEAENDKGEERVYPRCILIDDEGKSYVASSFGIYNCLERLCKVFGTPDNWVEPIKVQFIQTQRGEKRYLSLKAI